MDRQTGEGLTRCAMADPITLADVMHQKGWWAASAFVLAVSWRSLAVGQRIGRVEQRQDDHGQKLDYIIERLDRHIENTSANHD